MRGRITTAGYDALEVLVQMEPVFAKDICSVVRKGAGVAASKDVPVSVEEYMGKLILLAR